MKFRPFTLDDLTDENKGKSQSETESAVALSRPPLCFYFHLKHEKVYFVQARQGRGNYFNNHAIVRAAATAPLLRFTGASLPSTHPSVHPSVLLLS